MGLFEKLFPKAAVQKETQGYFKSLTAYTPAFTTYQGGLYEMELTRSAIHAFATSVSKLKPEITGQAYKNLEKTLQFKPNDYMDTTKFLYRIATILSVNTTAFILPMYEDDLKTVKGFYPILPEGAELIDVGGELWLRYTFANGQKTAIEFSKVGVLTQYQYRDDFFGDGNSAMASTLNLIDMQAQGIEEGIKQSATLRFMAKMGQILHPDDIEKEKNRFSKQNLSADNTTGVMMFDAKYSDVKQIDSKPFIVDAEQMKLIQNNVFNYFGVNEKILQNSFSEEEWNAYFEGKIEPFALQLSLVLSNMLFTKKELAYGNSVIFTTNRLQYASNTTKLNIVTQLFDRGFLTHNQGLEIFNMSPVEDGDKRYIRKEYTESANLDSERGEQIAISEDAGVSESSDTTAELSTVGETD